ncbi:MAG: phospho-sugar mutase [Planctomycetaceae bacterium]
MASGMEAIQRAAVEGKLSATAVEQLRRWLTEPPFARYRPRIEELVAAGRFDELDRLFWEVIPFGTGGRRGTMAEFGSATINDRTMAESAHGLAEYLKKFRVTSDELREKSGGGEPELVTRHSSLVTLSAVVACDTRNRSAEFARLVATTLAAHGVKVHLFEEYRSTPELSFAVRHLGCDAGVMITASHNPPSDNGFKAYWSNGGQVLPPHDKGIIDCVNAAGEIPTIDFDEALAAGLIELIGAEVDRAYFDAVLALGLSTARDMRAIFSPLHGVGQTAISPVLREAGFDGVEIFEPHRAPDGDFPNVPDRFPNPERSEVFAPLLDAAREARADLLLASDPDADRLGVMARDRDGEYVHLTGNRVGALLVDYILRKRRTAGTLSPAHYVVETLVTTPQIAAIAKAHGVRAIDDLLVGFKYIGRTIDEEGPERFVFGAEESLGYLAGTYARDKDAAIAALYLCELAAELRHEGRTVLDRLDELYAAHGYFTEGQRSETCRGARGRDRIDALMRAFRERPPTDLAGVRLARVRDYGVDEVRSLPNNRLVEKLAGPTGDLLFLDSMEDGGRKFSVAARPSGTEPKIKFYFFAEARCDGAANLPAVKHRTDADFTTFQQALSDWVKEQIEEH